MAHLLYPHHTGIRNPLGILGCEAWWDAMNFASITQSGGTVSNLADLSGGVGPDLPQATPGNRPSYNSSAVNTRPGITNAGTRRLLSGSNDLARNASGVTVFAVGYATTANTGAQQFLLQTSRGGAVAVRTGLIIDAAGKYAAVTRRTDAEAAALLSSTSGPSNGVAYIQVNVIDYAGGTQEIFVNGQSVASGALTSSGTSANTASNGTSLFAAGDGTTSPWVGGFAEGGFFNRAITGAQVRSLTWHLSKKWAINTK